MAWLDQTALENAITAEILMDLTDDANNPSAVDVGVMDAAIDLAVGTIKGKLKQRYPAQTGSETTSLDISEIALCLTVRNLYGRRMGYSVTKEWADRIERAITMLDSMRKETQGVAEWDTPESVSIIEHEYPPIENYDEWESTRTEAEF